MCALATAGAASAKTATKASIGATPRRRSIRPATLLEDGAALLNSSEDTPVDRVLRGTTTVEKCCLKIGAGSAGLRSSRDRGHSRGLWADERTRGCPRQIAVFLRGELDSERYGDKLRALLARHGWGEDLLRRPDLRDTATNGYRRQLLDEHRAYEQRDGLFLYFPENVEWFRAELERDEVLDILYINWNWWLALSGGSRRPLDAARRIRAGEIPGQTAHEDKPLAAALRKFPLPPELIAVTTPDYTPPVLVEGHVRLTAYALYPNYLPPTLDIVVGVSPKMPRWCQF